MRCSPEDKQRQQLGRGRDVARQIGADRRGIGDEEIGRRAIAAIGDGDGVGNGVAGKDAASRRRGSRLIQGQGWGAEDGMGDVVGRGKAGLTGQQLALIGNDHASS